MKCLNNQNLLEILFLPYKYRKFKILLEPQFFIKNSYCQYGQFYPQGQHQAPRVTTVAPVRLHTISLQRSRHVKLDCNPANIQVSLFCHCLLRKICSVWSSINIHKNQLHITANGSTMDSINQRSRYLLLDFELKLTHVLTKTVIIRVTKRLLPKRTWLLF
jgi:hypothetical protein